MKTDGGLGASTGSPLPPCTVSVIITTRDGSDRIGRSVAGVLASADACSYPTEIIVVDNASADSTAAVVEALGADDPRVRLVREPTPGQARARTTGIGASRGEVILFTDDDVEVPAGWIEKMASPLLEGRCDLVGTAVRLAPELRRPEFETLHLKLLADTADGLGDPPKYLVGASLGFARRVIDAGIGFDSELGPGALGFNDDVQFYRDARVAGFRPLFLDAVVCLHRPAASRTKAAAMIERCRRQGVCNAYLESRVGRRYGLWMIPGHLWREVRYAAARHAIRRMASEVPPVSFLEATVEIWRRRSLLKARVSGFRTSSRPRESRRSGSS